MEIRHLSSFRQLVIGKTKDQKRIPYHQYLEDISLKFRRITFNYLLRTTNKFADALATLASMISRRGWRCHMGV
ncbi:hypothetical protein CMV_014150 [Castanea mollissima]|uniref:RNase H type-1 domain-containing protein n=1 Tax=Castanea mollissima TaxID=60419 RepID=A0A8J4RCI8_9ROSI|nr:hypothetical protein CMV_014150 [Castanea mollissima]